MMKKKKLVNFNKFVKSFLVLVVNDYDSWSEFVTQQQLRDSSHDTLMTEPFGATLNFLKIFLAFVN